MAKPPRPFDVTLRDGSRVHIRPIRPDDKQRLQDGLRRLSRQSRYLRFHAPIEELSEAQLRYLTEIDYADHMAWVAEDATDPDGRGLAVARYVRLRREPDVAEAAVTVADEHQGKGLGSILLTLLCRSAIEHGIRSLRNYVLTANEAMLRVFDELGATRVDQGDGVTRVDMPLPRDPDELLETPALRVLRASAKRRIPPFRDLFARLERGNQGGSRSSRNRTSP